METRVFWFYICKGTWNIFLKIELKLKNSLPQKMQWTFQSAFLFHLIFILMYILNKQSFVCVFLLLFFWGGFLFVFA